MHSAQSTLRVERRHFQVVTLDVEGVRNMVADHVQPVHLFFVEFLAAAGMALHDPGLEVAAHGVVEGG